MTFKSIVQGPDYDFSPTPTALSYAIATYMRSGSSNLCRTLWEIGDFGAPWEYQNSQTERWRDPNKFVGDCVDYNLLKNYRTGPNGVFGIKFMPEAVAAKLPPIDRWIYLTRDNELARAISEVIAMQTKSYWSTDPADGIPLYDHKSIMDALIIHRHQKFMWEQFFTMNNITPLRLTYEAIDANTPEVIADFIGITITGMNPVTNIPVLNSQHTETNDAWYAEAMLDQSVTDFLAS